MVLHSGCHDFAKYILVFGQLYKKCIITKCIVGKYDKSRYSE
jgi:hypothetical protein